MLQLLNELITAFISAHEKSVTTTAGSDFFFMDKIFVFKVSLIQLSSFEIDNDVCEVLINSAIGIILLVLSS